MTQDLSKAQCVLLTVHYASAANIKALHSFTPTRADALEPELILRILLTYLPETLDPREYVEYVSEVASRLYLSVDREEVEVDTAPVAGIANDVASKRVRKLRLLDLRAPSFPPDGPDDLLTRFVCHRAYRIDSETGLLNLLPALVTPFLPRNDFIRVWYITIVLPVLRLQSEYYAEEEAVQSLRLDAFETMSTDDAIGQLLQTAWDKDVTSYSNGASGNSQSYLARDVKGVVGPWMYGHTDRKRRKLAQEQSKRARTKSGNEAAQNNLRSRKVSLTGVTAKDKTDHDWESLFRWLVIRARDSFPIITHCIEEWDGPSDVDLGGIDASAPTAYLDEDSQRKLELQYCQAAFSACYAADVDTESTIRAAHGVLARLAEILDFIPPPDLATSVDSLPKIERHATKLDESQTVSDLEPDRLLSPEHPLTTPRLETYMLLQMMVYSAYQFASLGYPISLLSVTKLHFYASEAEQVEIIRTILRKLSDPSSRKDEEQWKAERDKLLWLWNWGILAQDSYPTHGAGVLGKVSKATLEQELLKCFVDTNCYRLAIQLYLEQTSSALPASAIEDIVLAKAMEAYDGASNGNRTRGGMKKAHDIISTFRPYFRDSLRFREATALIQATHALSFYSLTLQHGVPFKPVSIRVSQDPVRLIEKVLEQNPRSYTKLDDLVDIGRNLVSTGLESSVGVGENDTKPEHRQRDVERRVTFMAVEAALREDDFETAYSYVVNRLTPSEGNLVAPKNVPKAAKHTRVASRNTMIQNSTHDDDTSWRAAFMAGRYRPATAAPPTIRRLEQRTELLSLALLLAPTTALTEVLAAWRKCEEETTALQLAQAAAERAFDDQADQRGSRALPGHFTVDGEQPPLILNQERRELGRVGNGTRSDSEAPLSMFDLTRSAARAFSQSAFPLRGSAGSRAVSGDQHASPRASLDAHGDLDASLDSLVSDGSGSARVRKRDMVASAVSGGLASGLGWVLGATPVEQPPQQQQTHTLR